MSSLLQYLLCHSSKCWQQKVFGTCIHILMRYSLSKITSRGLDFQIQKKKKKQKKRLNFLKKLKKNCFFKSNCQHLLDHQKSKRVPEKHLFLLYSLYQSLCVDHNKLWKILKEMGIPDHLICLLRNLYRSGSNS